MKRKKEKKKESITCSLTLKEAYSSFKTENPGCKICFSKFCDVKLSEVKLVQDITHSSCLCIYHENVQLILISLNKYVKTIPTEF